MVVFTHPEVELFSDTLKDMKVIKIDEIEAVSRGRRAVLESKTIESIANLISCEYGKGSRSFSIFFRSPS